MIVFPIINTVIFVLLALLHVYWALGGKWWLKNAIPKTKDTLDVAVFHPGVFITLVVAAGLLGFGALHFYTLQDAFHFMDAFLPWGIGGIALIFALRAIGDFKYVGLFKRVYNSDFAIYDTRYYIPLCVFISINAVFTYFTI